MTKHNNNRYTKNLNHVRAAFEKAAFQYDEYSILQRTIADRLDESLEQIKINPKTILDLGFHYHTFIYYYQIVTTRYRARKGLFKNDYMPFFCDFHVLVARKI